MKWFKEVFLPSFEQGKEVNISEKQFRIFEKYLKNEKEVGYLYTIYDIIDGLKIEAYEWCTVGKHRYYLTITKQDKKV